MHSKTQTSGCLKGALLLARFVTRRCQMKLNIVVALLVCNSPRTSLFSLVNFVRAKFKVPKTMKFITKNTFKSMNSKERFTSNN